VTGSAAKDELKELLRFYAEAGADVALSEEPIDRFALTEAQAETRRASASPTRPRQEQEPVQTAAFVEVEAVAPSSHTTSSRPPPNLAVPSEAAVMAARDAAATAETLDELRATLASFEGCNLRFTATNLVFADGNPQARVMFVGEAPGFDEDMQGLPFVGRSGQLLDRMLKAIGLDRTTAYIANVIPWRPPGNREPSPQETEICRPFIERQILLADPDFLVPLGGASTKQLFRTTTGITRLRGAWREFDTGRRKIRAMATLHPAYLLRRPLEKKLVWRDLLALNEALQGPQA
jgi:uracil-DNA glycosylase